METTDNLFERILNTGFDVVELIDPTLNPTELILPTLNSDCMEFYEHACNYYNGGSVAIVNPTSIRCIQTMLSNTDPRFLYLFIDTNSVLLKPIYDYVKRLRSPIHNRVKAIRCSLNFHLGKLGWMIDKESDISLLVSSNVLESISYWEQALYGVSRIISEDGTAIITAPYKSMIKARALNKDKYPLISIEYDTLRKILLFWFKRVRYYSSAVRGDRMKLIPDTEMQKKELDIFGIKEDEDVRGDWVNMSMYICR